MTTVFEERMVNRIDQRGSPRVRAQISAAVKAYHARRMAGESLLEARPRRKKRGEKKRKRIVDPTAMRPDEGLIAWLRRTARLGMRWRNELDEVQRTYAHYLGEWDSFVADCARERPADRRRLREGRRDLLHRCRQELLFLRIPSAEAQAIALDVVAQHRSRQNDPILRGRGGRAVPTAADGAPVTVETGRGEKSRG